VPDLSPTTEVLEPPETRIIRAPAASAPIASTRRLAILLFLSLNFLFLLTSTGRVRTADELMTLFESESLVLHGSTSVPQAVSAQLYFGRFDRNGQPRPAYTPGQALATMPWYALGQFGLRHAPGVSADARDLIIGFAMTMSCATFAAAAGALMFLIFCGLGLGTTVSLVSALLVTLATPLFSYSGWYFSEPLACALLLGAVYVLFVNTAVPGISARNAAIAGAMLGFAVLVRPTHILLAGIILVAVLVRDGLAGAKPAIIAGLVLSVFVLGLLTYDQVLFGNAFAFGYPVSVEAGKNVTSFQTPLWRGMLGFLLSPGKSVFLFAPPILLAIAGLPRLWQRDRGIATIAGLSLPVALGFFARYTQWEGGYCFGPRYLVPALLLFCLAVGPVLAGAGPRTGWVAGGLFALGFAVQALGLAISFLEAEVGRGYYDRTWTYRMNYAGLLNQLQLLWKYAQSGTPARIGLGFDRWFIFLSKGGVSPLTLGVYGFIVTACAAVCIALLVRCLRADTSLAGCPE
jgi:hypothetical protein